jgi:hypothetical protein
MSIDSQEKLSLAAKGLTQVEVLGILERFGCAPGLFYQVSGYSSIEDLLAGGSEELAEKIENCREPNVRKTLSAIWRTLPASKKKGGLDIKKDTIGRGPIEPLHSADLRGQRIEVYGKSLILGAVSTYRQLIAAELQGDPSRRVPLAQTVGLVVAVRAMDSSDSDFVDNTLLAFHSGVKDHVSPNFKLRKREERLAGDLGVLHPAVPEEALSHVIITQVGHKIDFMYIREAIEITRPFEQGRVPCPMSRKVFNDQLPELPRYLQGLLSYTPDAGLKKGASVRDGGQRQGGR